MSDPTTEALGAIVREREELKARVAALESQLEIARQGHPVDRMGHPVDPERYEVYRDAVVILSTFMAGVRVSGDREWQRMHRTLQKVADEVDPYLRTDPCVGGSVH